MSFRAFIVVLFILIATPCLGAMIYLKDGGVEESDKVWEQDGYIHFILKGTKQVEIRYSKEIIDRIEGAQLSGKKSAPLPDAKRNKESVFPQNTNKSEQLTRKPCERIINRFEARLNQLTGVGFYDPRRPEKYWIDITSHHNTLKQAIADLAKQYGRPPAWVIANMGKVNDLGVIHRNLIESIRKSEATAPGNAAVSSSSRKSVLDGQPERTSPSRKQPQTFDSLPSADLSVMENIPFYNPGKPLKYWSDATTGHHTITEAIAAIAQKYGRSPAWVEENMGHVNDLGKIHRNLRQRLEQ